MASLPDGPGLEEVAKDLRQQIEEEQQKRQGRALTSLNDNKIRLFT